MIIDGSDRYSLREAAERSQYTEKTIRTYISQNKVDATRINGEWFVTKAGLTALLRKHKAGEPDPNADLLIPDPTPIPTPSQPSHEIVPSPEPEPKKGNHRPYGKSLHFISDEAVEIYDRMAAAATICGVSTRTLACRLISDGLDRIAPELQQITQLENKKLEIIATIS